MSERKDLVIYAYSRPDRTFYYIGKGKPSRPYDYRRRVKRPDGESRIHILHKGLDNKTANDYERGLILFYGRKDLYPGWGILRNMTDGGDGIYGLVFTQQHRDRLSEAAKNRKMSEKQKRFLSESRKGENNPMYGKVHPSRESRHPKYRALHWFHPVCGEVLNKSASELVKMFPEQELKINVLGSLSKGRCFNVKGWRTLSCPMGGELHLKRYKETKPRSKKFNWFHPERGFIYNKSSSEMCKLFPEQKLDINGLNLVSKGLRGNHKGWSLNLPTP